MNIANSDLSNAITAYGRLNIKRTSELVVEKLNKMGENWAYLCQEDTDSFYMSLDGLVEHFRTQKTNATRNDIILFLESFMEKVITPMINESSKEIAEWFNAYENSLAMDAEIIADTLLSSGKKKYAARIWWDEGTHLSKPKKKVVGLDIKRSSTPADARVKLSGILDYIFDEDQPGLIDMYNNYKDEMKKLPIDQIAIPTGVKNIDKYVDLPKGIPMHVRASIVHNNMLIDKDLKQFQKINNGDKIKYVFLKKNPLTRSDVIAFNDPEFIYSTGLIKYIHYERLFERTFESPVKGLTDVIGWNISKSGMIASLF